MKYIFTIVIAAVSAMCAYALTSFEVQPDKSVRVVEEKGIYSADELQQLKAEYEDQKKSLTEWYNARVSDLDDKIAKIDLAIEAAR